MRTRIALILSGLLISCGSGLGQQPVNPPPGTRRVTAPVVQQQQTAESDNSLTRFDLDFPGGTPEQLVRAIEKASGKLPNVVVPVEHADFQLPPLKMKAVTVPRLFEALSGASVRNIRIPTPGKGRGYDEVYNSYSFQTLGPPNEDLVWYFSARAGTVESMPPHVVPVCRFYQLGPYMDTYKVEDITTAIQTGWKMLGEKNPPTITYHKDTKLLIAVGEQDKLILIDEVLRQLSNPVPKSDAKPSPPKATASEKSSKGE